jgi:hypothetical protein
MAAGDSALKICSDALLLLGARPISSFNEGTDSSNLCDRLYPDLKRTTLQMYPWSFSFKKAQLARTINTPVNEYKYEYQLPSDMLGAIRKAFSTEAIGVGSFTDWTIQGDKLLTNVEKIVIDYQFSVNEDKMPSYFVQLLKYMMAWHLAGPITDQVEKTQYWQAVAVGNPSENNRGGFFRTASSMDGQGQTSASFEDFSLIAVRN